MYMQYIFFIESFFLFFIKRDEGGSICYGIEFIKIDIYRISALEVPFPVPVRVDFVCGPASIYCVVCGPHHIIFLNAFRKFSLRNAYRKGFTQELVYARTCEII